MAKRVKVKRSIEGVVSPQQRFKSADELVQAAGEYFSRCDASGEEYTFTGLLLHLGVTKRTWHAYLRGDRGEELAEAAGMVSLKLENELEKRLYSSSNKGMVTGYIFSLKSNFDWRDRQIVSHEGEIRHKISAIDLVIVDPKSRRKGGKDGREKAEG